MEIGTVASTKIILFENIFLFSSSLFLFFFFLSDFCSHLAGYTNGASIECACPEERKMSCLMCQKSVRSVRKLVCSARALAISSRIVKMKITQKSESKFARKNRERIIIISQCARNSLDWVSNFFRRVSMSLYRRRRSFLATFETLSTGMEWNLTRFGDGILVKEMRRRIGDADFGEREYSSLQTYKWSFDDLTCPIDNNNMMRRQEDARAMENPLLRLYAPKPICSFCLLFDQ